jgi:hypothetical protein
VRRRVLYKICKKCIYKARREKSKRHGGSPVRGIELIYRVTTLADGPTYYDDIDRIMI